MDRIPFTISFDMDMEISGDVEAQAMIIINKLLKDCDHSTQHRILDYFKDKFNMSEVKITYREDDQ